MIIKEGGTTMLDYSPLWKTMQERHVSQYRLLQSGINTKTLYQIKRNENITLLTLEKLCRIIGCTPNDVVRFVDENEQRE